MIKRWSTCKHRSHRCQIHVRSIFFGILLLLTLSTVYITDLSTFISTLFALVLRTIRPVTLLDYVIHNDTFIFNESTREENTTIKSVNALTGKTRKVLVFGVDGLQADQFRHAFSKDNASLPGFSRLVNEGSF